MKLSSRLPLTLTRLTLVAVLAATVSVLVASPVFAAGWQQLQSGPGIMEENALAYDGRYIYSIGGFSGNLNSGTLSDQLTDNFFRYDTVTNSWITLPPLPIKMKDSKAFYKDGELYVFVGGALPTGDYDTSGAEFMKYDIASQTWSNLPNVPGYISSVDASFAFDGNNYIYLTYYGTTPRVIGPEHFTRYSIADNTWEALPTPPILTGLEGIVADGENGVYLFGGGDLIQDGSNLGFSVNLEHTVQKFDPTTGTWETMPNPFPADQGVDYVSNAVVAATSDNNGTIYSLVLNYRMEPDGIVDTLGDALYSYTPATDTWSVIADTPVMMSGSSMFWDGAGSLYVNQGSDLSTFSGALYRYGTPENVAPVANGLADATINPGDTYTATGSISDPDSTAWTATVDYGDGSGIQQLSLNGTAFSLSHQFVLPGTYTTTVTVTDNQGASGQATAVIMVHANAPQLSQLAPATANIGEGATFSANSSFTDPDSTSWTATVDYGDGSGVQPLTLNPDKTFALAHTYQDEGTYTVTVAVTNNHGAVGTTTATVTVGNAPFSVSAITAPTTPTPVNTTITTSASISDPGTLDTHMAVWDWGDGTTSQGTVAETSGSGTVSGSHSYTAAGVYTVSLTVTDDDGLAVTAPPFQYMVIYDPSAGFVTGSGWINSPLGAYIPSPTLTGKAVFGFVSKYQNGASIPTGSTQFRFDIAHFLFQSTSYQWLVVSGAKAQFKGLGTVNGSGNYGFLLTGIDGALPGGGGSDKFRIKIWDIPTGNVVYDNQMGTSDTSNPTTVIGGGNIIIHS